DRHRRARVNVTPVRCLALLDEDRELIAEAKERSARDRERSALVDRDEERRVHLRLDRPGGVLEHAAHPRSSRRGVERAGDVVDGGREDAGGEREELQVDPGPDADAGRVYLVDVGNHPDLVELTDGEQLDRGAAILPGELDALGRVPADDL